MPSYDVTSDIDWQELDNAIQQARREVGSRFDFKGVESKIDMDKKAKTVTLWCSQSEKLDSLKDVFQNKTVKRGLSLLAFDFETVEDAFGGSSRQLIKVQAGIAKDKAKELISELKKTKIKVQAQIQDEQLRVTGKSRDLLQESIGVLKELQEQVKIPLQFGNFRD